LASQVAREWILGFFREEVVGADAFPSSRGRVIGTLAVSAHAATS